MDLLRKTFAFNDEISFSVRLRHWFIIVAGRNGCFPVVCCIPYLAILGWLLMRGLLWVAQVLLAPLLMGGLLAGLTIWWPVRSSERRCLVVRCLEESIDLVLRAFLPSPWTLAGLSTGSSRDALLDSGYLPLKTCSKPLVFVSW